MKKTIALLLSLVMSLTMLAACGGNNSADGDTTQPPATQPVEQTPEEPDAAPAPDETVPSDPIAALPGSIWYFGYPVEGMDPLVQFFHFYPDDLGIGATFYAGYAWNQITFSGTWTVEESPCNYDIWFERAEEGDPEVHSGTAPYTITLYGWDGAELDKLAYDGEYVYNISVNTNCGTATGGGTYRLSRADAAALSEYASTFDGELGIAYMNFINPDDASCTVQLNTNGTYDDLAFFAVEGTWAKTGDNEYTLTPNDSTDDGATLALQEDGSYLYTSTSGETMAMNEVKNEVAVVQTFAGTAPFPGMDTDVDVTLTAFDDGTCTVVISAFGTEMPIDQGTWSEENYTFTFVLDAAGECVSEFGGDTGVQVAYNNPSVAAIGDAPIETVLGVVL